MEYLKTYYSLEKHLEETVKYNPQFEILNAIWKLNKKNLTSALSNVSQYFPHYSLHERSHSNTIINNIELFLGEERIKKLSPTNTWLLLMASFTHDLGMVVFQELIEKEWESSEFQKFLTEIYESEDLDLKDSAKILITLQNTKDTLGDTWDSTISPIKIKNAVTLVVAEYMRKIHHQRSSDILKGIDKTFNNVANSFYSDQIPNRLLNLLGDVAYLHGVEFYEIFKRLDFESNGISNDKINPRFIACMLRLGDLLDIDDGRFNVFTTHVFKLPESSALHRKKHSSIKHFLITPEAIEVTADCPEEQIYRIARNWFDWLELEVENLNKEWSNIAPSDLTGSAPRIPKGKIKVFFNGSRADENLLNLRFQVSNEKIFEILEGGSIYEKAEFTFLRELVQNSLDASKIQLWREIEHGTYDFVFRTHFKNEKITHEEIIEKIRFPKDIPEALNDSFLITLNLKWANTKKDVLIIEVIDSGTGISDRDLIRMTAKVGQSRKEDKEYNEMLKRMPFWLKPTGAFGIGLQSLFIITDSFNVYTKSEGESAKSIIFRSSKKGKYSTVKDYPTILQRGTKVEILIPVDRFHEVFGTTFGWDIISAYDPFTDEYGNIYIHKIKSYVESVLFRVNNLRVHFFDKEVSNRLEYQESQGKFIGNNIQNDNAILQVEVFENELYFNFFENIIGSQFTLRFFADDFFTHEDYWPAYETEFFVRDIPVKSNLISYYVLSYCKLYWNFMSQSSDKILSITREKFLHKEKSKIDYEFKVHVLPKSLQLINDFFSDENIKSIQSEFTVKSNHLNIIYFKIVLTLKANNVPTLNLNHELLKHQLPIVVTATAANKEILMVDFLNAEKLIVPIQEYNQIDDLDALKNFLIESYKDIGKDTYVIYKARFFHYYLVTNYTISEIRFYDKGTVITLSKEIHTSIKVLQGEAYYYRSFWQTSSISERAFVYAHEKYSKDLSVYNEYNSGFERFPYLSTTSIISPFNNKRQLDLLISEYKWKKGTSKELIKKSITADTINKYVTTSLIEWIIQYNPDKNYNRTSEQIVDTYRELITEIIYYKLLEPPTAKKINPNIKFKLKPRKK